jgi:hypothetical protein
MKIQYACLLAGLSLAVSSVAFGQSAADVSYCNALAAQSRQVTAGGTAPPAEVPVAISKCSTGDAGAIKTLEKYLTENKQPLPKR